MNYGPLEFANYLSRDEPRGESAIVKAARAAQPLPTTPVNLLRVTSSGVAVAANPDNPSPAPLELGAK